MSSNKQPKTKKQSTSTSLQQLAAPTTLDALPDEILLNIAEFTGAHSCYLGYGTVNKRINQLFNTYSNKLSKSTSYGGYAPFQEIVEKCVKKMEDKEKVYQYCQIPEIFHKLASGAITFNREELLHWAIEKKNKFLHREICGRALRDGKLLIFQKVWNSIDNENVMSYMKEQTNFIYVAAGNGHLDWLIYLREELECEWDSWACEFAAYGGHLGCLKYLHKHGCGWDEGACENAARGGHLDCLTYLHEQGCPWNKKACSDAAYGGHLDCLRYLHEQGCEWDEAAHYFAAIGGHLDCLVYLHERGCGWDKEACYGAARWGYLDCLTYLHKNGCELNKDACKWAARNGHLDCLQYMRDNGLEWDQYDDYLGNEAQRSDP